MPLKHQSYARLFTAASLLALTCGATGQSAATERISGTVTAQAAKPVSGSVGILVVQPVARAVVTLESMSGAKVDETKTDANGQYEFPNLKPGMYGLVAKTANSCAISSAVNAGEGSATIVALRLKDGLCSSSVQFVH